MVIMFTIIWWTPLVVISTKRLAESSGSNFDNRFGRVQWFPSLQVVWPVEYSVSVYSPPVCKEIFFRNLQNSIFVNLSFSVAGDPFGRFNRTRVWQNLPGLPGGVQALMPGSKDYLAYSEYSTVHSVHVYTQNQPGLPGGVQALMPGSKDYLA